MRYDLPIIESGNSVYKAKGLLDVQLEVPLYSTLKQPDIDNVLAIASWNCDPNSRVVEYEGGRAIEIERIIPRKQKDTHLTGLHVSGIGYVPLIRKGNGFCQDTRMLPPTTQNFCETDVGKIMETSYAENGKIVQRKQTYQPLGAYNEPSMRKKIANTRTASSLDPRTFNVCDVECYGRYTDLTHEGEYAGFIVFSMPNPHLRRFADQCQQFLRPDDFINEMFTVSRPLGLALREIHDKKYCHRQPHISNLHYNKTIGLYLMDWDTMQPLADGEDGIVQRMIDVTVPQRSAKMLLGNVFEVPDNEVRLVAIQFMGSILSSYFGDPNFNVEIEIRRLMSLENGDGDRATKRMLRERLNLSV